MTTSESKKQWPHENAKLWASTVFHTPTGDITMAPFAIFYCYYMFCSNYAPKSLHISLNQRCYFVFFSAARQRLAVWGRCTLTLGKIWAGSGYISQQVTMPIIAWGPAPTSGMLKTNILRYSAAPCSPHPFTWLNEVQACRAGQLRDNVFS